MTSITSQSHRGHGNALQHVPFRNLVTMLRFTWCEMQMEECSAEASRGRCRRSSRHGPLARPAQSSLRHKSQRARGTPSWVRARSRRRAGDKPTSVAVERIELDPPASSTARAAARRPSSGGSRSNTLLLSRIVRNAVGGDAASVPSARLVIVRMAYRARRGKTSRAWTGSQRRPWRRWRAGLAYLFQAFANRSVL